MPSCPPFPASTGGWRGALDAAEGAALERASWRCAVFAVGEPSAGVQQARGPAMALGAEDLELLPEGVAVHERKFVDRKTSANLKFVSSKESSCPKVEYR